MSLRQKNKARTRSSIVEAANALIMEAGLAAATTREIAVRANVSYQTLYNYFPSKGHIVQAILADDLERWSAGVDVCIKRYDGNLITTLTAINQLGFTQLESPQRHLWREVGLAIHSSTPLKTELETLNQVGHDRIHALLSIAQGTGELASDIDLHLLAHTIFCLSDYALLRFFAGAAPSSATDNASEHAPDASRAIANLQEQLVLLLSPYLRNATSETSR